MSQGHPDRPGKARVVGPTTHDLEAKNVDVELFGSGEVGDHHRMMMKREPRGHDVTDLRSCQPIGPEKGLACGGTVGTTTDGSRRGRALATPLERKPLRRRGPRWALVVLALAPGLVIPPACLPAPSSHVGVAPRDSASTATREPDAPSAEPAGVVSAPPVVSSTPPVVAYDREKDIRDRTAEAKRELGADTPTILAGGVFLLAGAPGWRGESLRTSYDLVEGAMVALYHQRLKTKPQFVIPVYLFADTASYEKYCTKHWKKPCLSKYGSYHPDEHLSVMNAGLGLGTLTHEMVHPLIEADFPSASTWIDEGIASLFEAPLLPKPGEIHGARNWRLPRLTAALGGADRETSTLDMLFGMSDRTFRDDDESLHYAMARYTCQWLDEQNQLWPFYQYWRDSIDKDPSGSVAFYRIVGRSPLAAKDDWVKWVRGR